MKKEKEDFYIAMLRYGKTHLEAGFRLQDLIKHLQDKGYFIPSESSTLMHHYFPKAFYSNNETSYPDIVSFFFLKPESYFHLLESDNIIAARKEARETRRFAIIAIVLTLLSIIAPYVVDLFS
jgi:hypothetical protein